MYNKNEDKPFMMLHCWSKLKGQSKCSDITHSLNTANAKGDEVGETRDGVGGVLAPATHVSSSRERNGRTRIKVRRGGGQDDRQVGGYHDEDGGGKCQA